MFCTKCGTRNDESSNFCIKCGAPLEGASMQSAQPAPGEEQETVLLTVPKCRRDKFARGTDFYNLLITNRRIICGKTGGSFFRTSGLAGALVFKITKDRQDAEKFSVIDPDEIVNLDRHNFAVPFVGFDEIKVSRLLGSPQIRFKLNREGRGFDRNSAVPRFLTFDGQYLEPLQTTLKSLAGTIVKT